MASGEQAGAELAAQLADAQADVLSLEQRLKDQAERATEVEDLLERKK